VSQTSNLGPKIEMWLILRMHSFVKKIILQLFWPYSDI